MKVKMNCYDSMEKIIELDKDINYLDGMIEYFQKQISNNIEEIQQIRYQCGIKEAPPGGKRTSPKT